MRISIVLSPLCLRDSRVYLPTDPSLLVRGVLPSKSSPMASAAKVPILVTFQVTTANKESRDSDADDHQHTVAEGSSLMKQALIFKVGDDTRQDVLALQVKCGAFSPSLKPP